MCHGYQIPGSIDRACYFKFPRSIKIAGIFEEIYVSCCWIDYEIVAKHNFFQMATGGECIVEIKYR